MRTLLRGHRPLLVNHFTALPDTPGDYEARRLLVTLTAGGASIAQLYGCAPVGRTGGGTRYIDLTDDFVSWLSFANAGMLNKGNLLCFDYVMRNLPSENPMVEIGSFAGLSTNLINYYRRRHGATNALYTCDAWRFEGAVEYVGDSDISHDAYRQFVRETYMRNVGMFSGDKLPRTVDACADDFFAAWGAGRQTVDVFGRGWRLGGPISFCYIDGDHRYEAAARDFRNTDRFLEPGGFVLFDDSADGSKWEVTRVIEEVKRLGTYRVVIQNPNYLFQKIS